MAGTSSNVKIMPLDPDYIKFLLDPDLKFGCYFVVGNEQVAPVETIGVVRKMLAAHSSVFRAQLLDRRWESKEPEEVKDILPATFKNLLRFVYGHDTTATMSFEDADDLLYAADRYIMNILKDKLATRLLSLLNYTNICSLLTNPACATVLELHSTMTKILQCETDKVLSTPQFLSCCAETFVKILEQEVMNITELQVWKAAVEWAKNKAKKEDAKSLRQQLEKPLQHIRVCSLSFDEIGKEVIPTGVLTNEEVGAVCTAVATKTKPGTLTTVCNNMQLRQKSTVCNNMQARQQSTVCNNMQVRQQSTVCNNMQVRQQSTVCNNTQVRRDSDTRGAVDCVKSGVLKVNLGENGWFWERREHSFSLQTHALAVELVALTCNINRIGQFTVTVRIESTQATAQTVTHTGIHTPVELYRIPVSTEQRPVVLSANTQYNITLSCDTVFCVYIQTSAVKTQEHFTLGFPTCRDIYASPVVDILYKTLTSR